MNDKADVAELFYEDFLSSGLLPPDLLNTLIEQSRKMYADGGRGVLAKILSVEEVPQVTLQLYADQTPENVVITFAGVEISRTYGELVSDLSTASQMPV